jgi:hypothetical protein
LDLDRADIARWHGEYLSKFRDWCSAHERNARYVSTQLAFIDYELRNSHHLVGDQLMKAKTETEAVEICRPYFQRVGAGGIPAAGAGGGVMNPLLVSPPTQQEK